MRRNGRTQAKPLSPQRMDFGQGKARSSGGSSRASIAAASTRSPGRASTQKPFCSEQRLARRAVLAEEALQRLLRRADARAALLASPPVMIAARSVAVSDKAPRAVEGARLAFQQRRDPGGEQARQVLRRARLHPRRDLLREEFEQQLGHGLHRPPHVGAGEVLALEQQRLAPLPRQRVGEAVAEVEPGRVVAPSPDRATLPAPTARCRPSRRRSRCPPSARKLSRSAPACLPPRPSTTIAVSTRAAADIAGRLASTTRSKRRAFRLAPEDRNDRRSVHDHAGKPVRGS